MKPVLLKRMLQTMAAGSVLLSGCVLPPPPHVVLQEAHERHRRIIRSVLPPHARPVVYRGERCWHCDGRYYRAVPGGYAVVEDARYDYGAGYPYGY